MASSKNFKDYVLEQLRLLDDVSYRSMMGEFLLYYHGKLFGGIYDDRFLVKPTSTNQKFNLTTVIPYPHAKPMYFIENVDDAESLQEIVKATCDGLK